MSNQLEWSPSEIKAAVVAYMKMLKKQLEGVNFNKAAVNAELRDNELSARTKSSVEFRMQNISAVCEELDMPWLKGYRPAENVGERVKQSIAGFINEIKSSGDFDGLLTNDIQEAQIGRYL